MGQETKMNTSIFKNVLVATGLALSLVPMAMADRVPDLDQYLDSEISSMNDAMVSNESKIAEPEVWFLRNMFVRVRPRVGFIIPGIAKVEFIPEVELMWQKSLPDQWKPYRP